MNEEEIIKFVRDMKNHFVSQQRYEIGAGLRDIEKSFENSHIRFIASYYIEPTIENLHIELSKLVKKLTLKEDKEYVYQYALPIIREDKLNKFFDQ